MFRRSTVARLEISPQEIGASRVRSYAISVAAVTLATSLRWALARWLHDVPPFLLQTVAVVAAATFGGFGPGLLGTALGAIAGYYLAARWNPLESSAAELRRFLIEGSLISVLGGWLVAARRKADDAIHARALLEKQMLDIGDAERRRFGHDLHDGLGQQLTGIALLSESLAHQLKSRTIPEAAQAEQISELVSETIGWTRELARGLSPITLETDGLAAAIEELVRRANRLFAIECTFDCVLETIPVPSDSALHVYRIVQEAISNSVRHGKAKHVQIRAAVEDGWIVATVVDDGSGLSSKTVQHPGIGLRIMQYRAKLIGARLSVERAGEQGGTVVRCALPVAASAHPSQPQRTGGKTP
jgi:signal transduction histidine kinase